MFSDYIRNKLKINNKNISRKSSNIWKLEIGFLNYSWAKDELTGKLGNILSGIKIKIHHFKIYRMQAKYAQKEVCRMKYILENKAPLITQAYNLETSKKQFIHKTRKRKIKMNGRKKWN